MVLYPTSVPNVIPIHKANSKENVEHYRPISLLSVVSKVAEKCIHNHIYPFIINKLSTAQHGFISGKSTATQLVQYVDDIGSILDYSGQADTIYLDFSKAFDSVLHLLLLYKLQELGIKGNLLKWFYN
jgi:hypothetical protein